MPERTPDSVRLALPREAPAVANLQWRALRSAFAAEPDWVEQLDPEAMAEVWRHAITRPPLATCRVLVAVADDAVVGFATTSPSEDPDAVAGRDGAVGEFLIDSDALGRGHGSRLLHACVDTLRADGFTRAAWWVRTTDDALRQFLISAGWAADGSHREIGLTDDSLRLKQIRVHTDISA